MELLGTKRVRFVTFPHRVIDGGDYTDYYLCPNGAEYRQEWSDFWTHGMDGKMGPMCPVTSGTFAEKAKGRRIKRLTMVESIHLARPTTWASWVKEEVDVDEEKGSIPFTREWGVYAQGVVTPCKGEREAWDLAGKLPGAVTHMDTPDLPGMNKIMEIGNVERLRGTRPAQKQKGNGCRRYLPQSPV